MCGYPKNQTPKQTKSNIKLVMNFCELILKHFLNFTLLYIFLIQLLLFVDEIDCLGFLEMSIIFVTNLVKFILFLFLKGDLGLHPLVLRD